MFHQTYTVDTAARNFAGMLFTDRITFERPRKTADGYLVTRSRAARSGIYDYLGSEVDPSGNTFAADQVVKVYRPESEVFAADSVASFLMKPITSDHPSQPVTANNWRDHAKGVIGKALRDGDFLAFDLVLMDKDAIADVESGKRELSNGYSSQIDFKAGETEQGDHYDAVMSNIRGNHVALVDKGRAGPLCRISDAADCATLPAAELIQILTDGQTYSGENPNGKTGSANSGGSPVATKTITFDGLPLEVTDAAEAAIAKLQGQISTLTDAKAKAEGDVAALTTDKATLEAKVTTLEQQVKDAKLTPQQLRDAAQAFAKTFDTAKKLAPTATLNDTMDEAAIKRAVVSAKLGDAAKDWSDEQVAVSFATLSAQVGDANADPVRNALSGGITRNADAAAVYDAAAEKRRRDLSTAWQGKPAANAA